MSNLITLTNPHSPAAEAYQSLRTSIEFSSLEQSLKTLLVTSADAHTDKSNAIANLAVVMAEAGDKVILVDGDLRRPQQHEIFGLHNQQGVSSWLTDGGPAPLQQTSVNRLQLLTAGPTHANPVALLSARRLGDALAELKEQADYILCDAPPVLAVTDAALWAAKVDGVVLLVNAGGTKRDQALQARQILERVHAHIVGAVLLNAERNTAMLGYEG
ncbi:MAG: CpsD/CapB family tyrosine-protein kinase [Caldilineaceae bacterium]|nr:CpsD/CapB family tyrosine-protein kinase [Caldilineaceae bacterium]